MFVASLIALTELAAYILRSVWSLWLVTMSLIFLLFLLTCSSSRFVVKQPAVQKWQWEL